MRIAGRKIRIERRHILAGRRCSRLYCPVNLAIQEKIPGATIRVQLNKIIINGEEFETPIRAARFMEWFDRLPTRRRAKETLLNLTFVLHRSKLHYQ